MKKLKSLIGITMGDAAGIGPEIICKMFLRKSYKKFCEILLIGDEDIFNRTIHHYKYSIRVRAVDQTEDVLLLKNNELGLIQIKDRINGNGFQPGRPNKAFGAAALKSVDTAVDLARHGKIDGIVTAPVNKEVVALTYKKFIGHTEYIAEKLKTDNFNMMMASSKMKVTLVTTHTAIKDVAKNITKKKVIQAIENTHNTLIKLGYRIPKIAVLSLNPHKGDGGLFGNEEEKIIIPAIDELKRRGGYNCTGPYVPDSFFVKYSKYPVYDGIIAMYHDQGLIPFKMLSFGSGINVTIGLPVIRTSVDHGTAYDIAGKDQANDRSLFEALKFAVNLSG